jgi:hypothetical protein
MSAATTEDIDALKGQIADLKELMAKVVAGNTASAPARPTSYSVKGAAAALGRAPYTVGEWCRLGQCHAYKLRGWKAGRHDRWRISAEEVDRIRAEGLLPVEPSRNAGKYGTG